MEFAATSLTGVLLGNPIRTAMLVDSGADTTMMDESYARRLGIDLSQYQPASVGGIGGFVPGRRVILRMLLCGQWLNVPVIFAPSMPVQLLGREGVFDKFFLAFAHGYSSFFASKA